MSRRRWRKESDESFSLWYSVSRNGRTSSRRNTSNFKLIGNEGRKDWRQVLLSSIYEILLRYSSVSLDFVFIIRRDLFIRVMSRNKIGNIRILTSPYIYIYIYIDINWKWFPRLKQLDFVLEWEIYVGLRGILSETRKGKYNRSFLFPLDSIRREIRYYSDSGFSAALIKSSWTACSRVEVGIGP